MRGKQLNMFPIYVLGVFKSSLIVDVWWIIHTFKTVLISTEL